MKISINTLKKGEPLGDLFGIFFEDLNHAGDGGLYGELIQNRAFEYNTVDNQAFHALTAWEIIGNEEDIELEIASQNPVNKKNPHYLAMHLKSSGVKAGIQNLGFNTGIPLKKDVTYLFSCYAKSSQETDISLEVSFKSREGKNYLSKDFKINTEWEKYELELTAPCTDNMGRLALTTDKEGDIYLDFVSLFPKDTFLGRKNGLRKDIAQMLADMRPKFLRFPGGCLVHCGTLHAEDRDSMYRWKNTIGPVEGRPARRATWGYNQSFGLGFFEYFQLCEDIGAKAIPVIPGGFNPHEGKAAPLEEMQEWIDEALDLIEFANGDIHTKWGAIRAEMGHDKPFELEYLGIGNEEQGEEFFKRYAIIHRAVKEKYPEIKLINTSGPFCEGGDYEAGWKSAREEKSDFVDEHYYQAPEWFLANHYRYDTFVKEDPKVFLGEYASCSNSYYSALAEASYMIGLERNAHAVGLACYAPLLCNADYVNWKPDLIWFNNHEVFGSASYYVQKLFMNHQGDYQLECRASDEEESEDWTKEEE